MTDTLDAMAALAKVARPIILESYTKSSCIVSTRIGIDVLDYLGVRAVPIPLFVLVMNAECIALVEQGMTIDEVQAVLAQRKPEEPGGPWAVGVGASAESDDSGGWTGHLVIGVPERQLLLDLSMDQASRPHKELDLTQPLLFPVTESSWWEERDPSTFIQVTNQSTQQQITLGLMRTLADPNGYRKSPNWHRGQDRTTYRRTTARVINAVRAELEER